MLMVVTLMFFTGVEYSVWVGELPQMIVDTSIGLVMTFAGIGEVVGMSVSIWLLYGINHQVNDLMLLH